MWQDKVRHAIRDVIFAVVIKQERKHLPNHTHKFVLVCWLDFTVLCFAAVFGVTRDTEIDLGAQSTCKTLRVVVHTLTGYGSLAGARAYGCF
jgi:hypothetical protein